MDATFGYKSSNLRDYVLEKAGSKFTVDDFVSISIEDIRRGIEHVTEKLLKVRKGSVVIVNAAAETDMHVFAAGILAGKLCVSWFLSAQLQKFTRLLITKLYPGIHADQAVSRAKRSQVHLSHWCGFRFLQARHNWNSTLICRISQH
jgi:uncharacterized protein YgbK (DUF1537 family)